MEAGDLITLVNEWKVRDDDLRFFSYAETAHYTVPDWQCLHSGFGHGVRAHQDVLKVAHSGILCCLPH